MTLTTLPWFQPIWEMSMIMYLAAPSLTVSLKPLPWKQGIGVLWAWAACSPCLVLCNKCCTCLHHSLVSVDWLYCMQTSRPKLGSITLVSREEEYKPSRFTPPRATLLINVLIYYIASHEWQKFWKIRKLDLRVTRDQYPSPSVGPLSCVWGKSS